MTGRVVLACAPGPGLPAAIARTAAHTGAEVIALALDLGQGGLHRFRAEALAAGAVAALTADAREDYAQHYCLPALQANALHPALVPALSRPLITRRLIAAAAEHGAHTVARDGDDQARFAAGVAALAPDLTALAWPDPRPGLERNLWCRPVPPIPDQGGRDAEELTLTFDRGVPVAIDGETVTVLQAVQELNSRAGAHGIGRIDEVHQAPGASTLITAHQELEKAVLEGELARFKQQVEQRWAELVQDGLWFSPLKDALDDFVLGTQEHVSGEVRLVLHGAAVRLTRLQDFERQWTGV